MLTLIIAVIAIVALIIAAGVGLMIYVALVMQGESFDTTQDNQEDEA